MAVGKPGKAELEGRSVVNLLQDSEAVHVNFEANVVSVGEFRESTEDKVEAVCSVSFAVKREVHSDLVARVHEVKLVFKYVLADL